LEAWGWKERKKKEQEKKLTLNHQLLLLPLPARSFFSSSLRPPSIAQWLLVPSPKLVLVPKLKLRLRLAPEPQQRSSKPTTTVLLRIELTLGLIEDSLSTKFLLPGFDGSSTKESTRRGVISRRLWRREEISRRAEKQRRGRRRELDLPTEERRREEEEEELVGRRRAREEGKGARVGRVSFRFSRLETLWGVEGGEEEEGREEGGLSDEREFRSSCHSLSSASLR